jgi:uncharacterized protein YbbC (DUF1343 family)
MVKLVGHRRLRLLLRLLADDVPGVERLLSFSPSFSRQNTTLIPGIRAKLKEAKAKGPQELETALTRWKDIYTEVEEGQRTVLRSKAVIEALAAAGK